MFEKYTEFIEKNAVPLLFIIFILTLFFGYQITSLEFERDQNSFIPEEETEVHERISQLFNLSSIIYIHIEGKNGSVLSLEALQESHQLTQKIQEEFDVEIFSADRFLDFLLRQTKNVSLEDIEEWDQLRSSFEEVQDLIMHDPFLRKEARTLFKDISTNETRDADIFLPSLYVKPPQITETLIIIKQPKEDNYIEELFELNTKIDQFVAQQEFNVINAEAVSVYILGDEAGKNSLKETVRLGLLAFFLIVIILSLSYRKQSYVWITLLIVIITIIWTIGTVSLLSFKMTFLGMLIIPLLFGISIDDSVHLSRRYHDELVRTGSVTKAFHHALKTTGRAIFLTTVTTMVGFSSNILSPSMPVKEFGIITAIGFFYAFLLTILLQQSLRYLLDRNKKHTLIKESYFKLPVVPLVQFIKQHTTKILLSIILITLFFGVVATKVPTEYDLTNSVPSDNKKSILFTKLWSTFRSPPPLYILIENNITDPQTINKISMFEDRMRQNENISFVGIESIQLLTKFFVNQHEEFRELWGINKKGRIMNPSINLSEVYRYLSTSDELIVPFVNMTYASKAKEMLHKSNGDFDATLITLYAYIPLSAEGNKILSQVEDSLDEVGLTASLSGSATVFRTIIKVVKKNQRDSSLLAAMSIFIFLWIIYRRVLIAAVLILPVIICTVWVFGAMYLLSIPLNFATAAAFPLIIGITIDYNIHIFERYKIELRKKKDTFAALTDMLNTSGTSLLISAITTFSAFFIVLFSKVGMLRDFGIICGLAIVFSLILSVFFLCPLLTKMKIDIK